MKPLIGISCCVKQFGVFGMPNHAASNTYIRATDHVVGGVAVLVPANGELADIATLVLTVAMGWVIWRMFLRPVVWLLEDRIALATELWVAWGEDPAQLELAKDEHGRRRLQLVRYAAVCPVCAGTIELRYSGGINRRRLVGCCSEVPHEHQYTFDRILRKGHRLPQHQE